MTPSNNQTENDMNLRYCIVAYLDIMGQKEALRNIDRPISALEKDNDSLSKTLKQTYGFIQWFRSKFEIFFNQARTETGIDRNIPEDKKDLFKKVTGIHVHLSHFSDSVIAWAPLEWDPKDPTELCVVMNSVWTIMNTCACMVILFLCNRHAIRGGIDVKIGCELKTGEPYGPALNSAYHLESQIADYPRIVIGNGLIEYLQAHKILTDQDIFSNLARERANKCLTMIKKDMDGFPFLDWLGKDIEQSFNDLRTGGPEQILKNASQFILKEQARFVMEQNPKLVNRYIKLSNYFHSQVSHWSAWKMLNNKSNP